MSEVIEIHSESSDAPILEPEVEEPPAPPSQKSDLPPLIEKVEGHVNVLGFSMRERRIFYETVMKLGAPPEDAYNSQWRPSCFDHKTQEEFNVYSSLFVRHVAEPCSQHAEFFVDGVPREGLNRQHVLTRLAIMSLIRKKVKEYEDVNGDWSVTKDYEKLVAGMRAADAVIVAPSQPLSQNSDENKSELGSQLMIVEGLSQEFKQYTPPPFQFNIADGGFTELHSLWAYEDAASSGKEYEIWHRRHDYWLLAGIVRHGYGCYQDIQADVRFAIVKKPQNRGEMFLERRFKLLEQALVIEAQLCRISLLNLEDINAKNKARRLFLQLQELVAEARTDVCRQPSVLSTVPKGISARRMLWESITPPPPIKDDENVPDGSSNQPYRSSRPNFVALLAEKTIA